jgi:fructokinase
MGEQKARPLIFGEVLFDHFPDGSVVLGGAPFNVAWHLQALGARPLFVSRVGNDALGSKIRDTMHSWGMDTSGLQIDSAHPTGSVQVSFVNGEPSFSILPDQAYDYISADGLPASTGCSLLYHGTLALRGQPCRHALDRLLAGEPASVLMDVNLRPPWWEREEVLYRLKLARWAKLNQDELDALTGVRGSIEDKAAALQHECGLDILIVTLGAAGALARIAGGEAIRVEPGPRVDIVDTVGAGDAFSAITLIGLMYGLDLHQTLQRAQEFAAAVVGIRGATPVSRDFYTEFLTQWGQA